VLTDGQTEINPLVSPECLPCLQLQSSLHGVVAVRKYTIRYTSYGPPRNKLRFILHAVDWLGIQHPHSEPPKPLWSDDIAAIVRQLHDTRASEDRRCLGQDSVIEEEVDHLAPIMDGAQEGESQPHTQFTFGTQIAHPIRPRPSHDEPKVLGVKRLEPVLAGNTQREDIRKRAGLLSLLDKSANRSTNKSPTKPTDNFVRPTLTKPQTAAESPASQPCTQLPDASHRQPTQTPSKGKSVASPSPQPSRGAKRVRTAEPAPRRSDRDEQPAQEPAHDTRPKAHEQSVLQILAAECSWMKDFEFSREALQVSNKQKLILLKDHSWHKPQAGQSFPDGNVPIEILMTLHRIADESAAMEGIPDSTEEMDEDPSPEDPVDNVNPSPESLVQASPDDNPPTSQVSWSASSSPEPPNIPSRFGQALPPDSSFEPPDDTPNRDTRKLTAITATQRPISIESSNEKEQSAPPSSPPFEQESIAVDDEMELEEYVPQGLGEDSVGGASELLGRPISISPHRPVIQVKETPYVKGKNGQSFAQMTSPRSEKQNSSGSLKNTSSGSIVYGTYNDKTFSEATKAPSHSEIKVRATMHRPVEDNTQIGEPRHQRPSEDSREDVLDVEMCDTATIGVPVVSPQQVPVVLAELSTMHAKMEKSTPPLLPETTPIPAQMPPQLAKSLTTPALPSPEKQSEVPARSENKKSSKSPSFAPGSTKRKLENSPSKRSSRHSKRREIKIVGFGDNTPATVDPASTLRQHREESLRKFREDRKSSTSFESRAGSGTELGVEQGGEAMDVDSPSTDTTSASPPAMSPRHVSLYEDPSPIEPAQVTAAASQPASVSSPIAKPETLIPEVPSPLPARSSVQAQSVTLGASNIQPLSVFETFKAAYPEYTGDVKHFQGQCTQMLDLEKDDKMVPKWQWDDYIIRNRTDYKAYVLECLDEGSNPEPYHRFYKDTIRDTIYQKSIIGGPATLKEALQQLGVQPPVPEPTLLPESIPPKEKRSRASLPSAFARPKAPSKSHTNGTSHDRPRHSLPANSQMTQQTPVRNLHRTQLRTPVQPTPKATAPRTNSTRKPNLFSRLSLDGAASSRASSVNRDTTEGTGDPFRDYVFAHQRLTSLTGSTKVSSKRSQSNGRKS